MMDRLHSFNESESAIIEAGGNVLLSDEFTNITHLYISRHGHTALYKAQRMGKWHVLKCLKPDHSDDPLYQGLLVKEFEIGYTLTHPFIVQTIGMEEVKSLGRCIILEYIDGVNLRHRLNSGKMDKTEAVRIISQAANALEYIHQRQIIHRDIKPENIMLTANGGNVKLIDFGLSDADSYAVLKLAAGTLSYASPEQRQGGGTDLRSDIFSLGKVISEIATITPLPARLRLKSIARRCTATDKNSRFQTDADLLSAITSSSMLKKAIAVTAILITVGSITVNVIPNGTPSNIATPPPMVKTAPSYSHTITGSNTPKQSQSTTAIPVESKGSSKPDMATAIDNFKKDSRLTELNVFAKQCALKELRHSEAVMADTTMPIYKRSDYNTYTLKRIEDKVKREVKRKIDENSPEYPIYLSAVLGTALATVREYNYNKYATEGDN